LATRPSCSPRAGYSTWRRSPHSGALLSLVLLGLPELRDRLALRRNRSLYSRIHHRSEIEPWSPGTPPEYLRLRLQRAGCDHELFASDAIGLLHEATVGAMRDIDRLAAGALRETAKKKRKLVERNVVARVIEADNRER
jgi:general secretion pathway protein A